MGAGDVRVGASSARPAAAAAPRRAPARPRAVHHLRAIAAEPRPAGSAAEAAARAHCTDALRTAGFRVREEPFEYSALPGRWATPLAGAASMGALAAAGHLAYRLDAPRAALALLAAAGATLAVGGRWLARQGVLRTPALRARGVNLVATRGGGVPAVWLVAHLDSKSQPVPMALRVAGIVGSGATWIAAAVVASLQAAGRPVHAAWPWVGAAGVLAGVPVLASVVGARSAGAVDDASGAAAVLLAAESLPRHVPVGVLLTSAEELGRAGARAFAAAHARAGAAPAVALNCDGVDDDGETIAMHSGGADAVLARLPAASARAGVPTRGRRLLPGILVDAVALADAGWAAITVSRGTAATLARIHTRRDTLACLRGDGVPPTAELLVALAEACATPTRRGA